MYKQDMNQVFKNVDTNINLQFLKISNNIETV